MTKSLQKKRRMVLMKINKEEYIKLRQLSPYQFLNTYFNIYSDREDIKQNFQTYLMIWSQMKGVDINGVYSDLINELDVEHNLTITYFNDKIINIC